MSDVIIEREAGVVTLTLNRPQARNALSDDMIRALDAAFASGEREESVRAYVIRGAGDHFMAGGDVKGFYASRNKPAEERRNDTERMVHQLHLLIYRMRRAPQPVIASDGAGTSRRAFPRGGGAAPGSCEPACFASLA